VKIVKILIFFSLLIFLASAAASQASSKTRLILRAKINSSFAANNNPTRNTLNIQTNLNKELFAMSDEYNQRTGYKYYTLTVK
jgi:P pilus assembly chaperone PapD